MKKTLDDDVEENLREEGNITEESPIGEAVRSLINVADRVTGKPSEVELKTDLSEDEVKIHTTLDVMSNILEMKEAEFASKCILADLINRKERKALSKERQSRREIVEIARQPDMPPMDMPENENFVKRFFTSRRRKREERRNE